MRRRLKDWITLTTIFVVFAAPAWGSSPYLFGPEQFIVGKGKPGSMTRTFTASTGQAVLTMDNGASFGDKRVSTGSLVFNGVEIITPADFNQQVGTIVRTVVLRENNLLTVNVGGAPGSFVTLHVTPGEGTPQPLAPTASLQANPLSIFAGDAATLSWTTTNTQLVTLEPGLGEVPLAGTAEVRPVQTTTYRLVAKGPGGQAEAEITVSVTIPAPLRITFGPYRGAALDGATVEGSEITVGGSVNVANPAEIGVTVNGVVAQVNSGTFVANNISLTEGLNTLTARATDAAGQTWTTSAQVFVASTEKYVDMQADMQTGIAPLTVTLSLSGNPTNGIFSHSLLCSGPAQKTPVASGDDAYAVTLDLPGLYTCRLGIVDSLGGIHEDTVGINVLSKTAFNAAQQAKWNAMTTALRLGNQEEALKYFSTRTREAYRRQMANMSSILGQIVADMQGISLVNVVDGKAIYELPIAKDGTTYSFQLEFIQDEDGLWRIRAF